MKLEDPVHLYLRYRNTDNNEMDEKITSATYTNLQNIRHIEFDSDVNFERFEVKVALQSGSVRGPVMSAGSYGKPHCHCIVATLVKCSNCCTVPFSSLHGSDIQHCRPLTTRLYFSAWYNMR